MTDTALWLVNSTFLAVGGLILLFAGRGLYKSGKGGTGVLLMLIGIGMLAKIIIFI